MAWHYTAAPDQVRPELGPDLLDGDYSAANPAWAYTAGVYSVTGGGRLALTVGDPHLYLALTPDAVYTITVEVRGADTVSWDMTLQNPDGDQVTMPVGDVDATPTGDWVTVSADWRAPVDPLTGSPAVTATGPGLVEIRNPVMAVQTGRVILTVPGDVLAERIMASGGIVAGTPGGARVEIAGDGLHAYDASGVETARIIGEGGEFVGGSFRTSDTLPGQVTISDTGYTHSGTGVSRPGIRIDPEDSTGLAATAGIGPVDEGFEIDGGRSTSGERTSILMSPGYSLIRADGSLAGTGFGDISVQPSRAEVVAREGLHRGSIRAVPGEVILSATHPSGANAAQAAADTLGARIIAYRTDGSRAGSVEATDTTATVSVRDAAGTTRGSMEVSETGATSRSFSGNASESGWVRARPQDAELAYVAPDNTYASRIKADASEAFIYTSAGGASRYLSVDANGVWVKTNESGSWKQYNLDPQKATNPFTMPSGWTVDGSNNASYTITLGMCYWGGVIGYSGTLKQGWSTIGYAPVAARPALGDQFRTLPTTSGRTVVGKIGADGSIEIWLDQASTGIFMHFSPFSYLVN